MRRREFIAMIGGTATAWPLAASAQQSTSVARIGFLSFNEASTSASYVEAFRAGLSDLGYVENKSFVIEFRFAEGNSDRLPGLAADLVRLNVDVIVANGPATLAAKGVTSTIPIVMVVIGDAVATGVITSLAHPGGNITGSTFFYPDIMAKRIELLKEALPSMTQAAVLLYPEYAPNGPVLRAMETTAKTLKVELQPIEARGPNDFDSTIAAIADKQIGAVVISDHPIFVGNAKLLAAIAAKLRLASIGSPELTAAGGLMSYGVNFHDLYRRAAYFVDKILKGAKPANLPVETPRRFQFVINLKTAKALGFAIPDSLLGRADEVIE